MVITPLTYFGPISWWKIITSNNDVIFDIHHHYIKQTFRNRCTILSANGPLNLSIPVSKPYGNHTSYKDIKIDNKQRWQAIHFKAIKSAYKASPYFDYFIDELYNIWTKEYTFLLDLTEDAFNKTQKIINTNVNYYYSEEYLTTEAITENNIDLRDIKTYTNYLQKPIQHYTQVFSDRFNFINDLSILDKIFNDKIL